jgi:hypothetical protein
MMRKAILAFRIFGEQKARLLLASQNQQHGMLLILPAHPCAD